MEELQGLTPQPEEEKQVSLPRVFCEIAGASDWISIRTNRKVTVLRWKDFQTHTTDQCNTHRAALTVGFVTAVEKRRTICGENVVPLERWGASLPSCEVKSHEYSLHQE